MVDYKQIVNKEENYISLESKDHIILLDFKNQIISKQERKIEGKTVDFSIEEFIYIFDIIGKVIGGEYGR